MPVLLFKLRHVPEDEAEEVRTLLHQHEINFYETTAGSWGIALPAMWLHDEQQLAQAKKLIDDYQKERARHARMLYEEQCRTGQQRTLLTLFQENPLKIIAYLLGILFMLYLATIPVSFLFS